MKRILSLAILATAMLASSCALKDDFKGTDSDFATVSVTVGEPGTVSTRAIGDGTTVDELHYAVYDDQANLIGELGRTIQDVTFPTQVKITLAKGQTYSIVFWAQNGETDAYSIATIDNYNDLRHITINYQDENNDEKRDAFFKTVSHTVTGDIELDVTLERPFAQINLGVTEEDWNAAKVAGIEVEKSEVVISNAATSLDLFNGKVGNGGVPVPVTYTASVIPGEDLMVDFDKNGTKEAYKYLSLSYILVCDETQTPDNEGMYGTNSSLVNTTFTLSTTKAPVVVKVDNLPVQRNWRTNVIGRMLTGDITFNIDVDPIFDGEENYPDTDEERLRFAALNGGTVTLTDDVELESSLIVADNKDMVIDLNGHNITNTSGSTLIGEGDGIIVYGNLTIKGNGTVSSNTRTVWARGDYGAKVTINGGHYIGVNHADAKCEVIYASGNGIIDIYGGTFEATNMAEGFAAPQYAVLNLHGNGQTGCDINVYGGTFVKFDPSNNISENPKKNFVEEGYYSVEKDGNFIVVENPANVLVSNLSELGSALNAATGDFIIGLIGDITGDVTVEQKPDVKITIEGNGHNYDGTILVNGKSARYATAGLTIQNINFKSTSITADAYINLGSGDNNTRYTSNVIVKNCTFEGYANEPVAVKSYTGGDHNLSIIGCTVDNQMHSLAQLANVETDLQIKDCKVYSKNGANINNSPSLEMSNCIFDVKGYAVRVGVNGTVNSEQKTFAITNSTLKSACAESDDAVIVFRTSATNAKLTLTSTTLTGARQIIGNTTDTQIIVK
ncbi:MAG: hypothetical protein IKC17_06195 [Bacteroidales bacterium]|nr:hypothetical protein [Bacteroidales bacterium]